MRYVFILFLLVAFGNLSVGQTAKPDSLFTHLAQEEDVDRQITLLIQMFGRSDITSPENMRLVQLLSESGKQNNSLVQQSAALTIMGSQYRFLGNPVRALHAHLQGVALARQLGNPTLLANALRQTGHVYKDRDDYARAIGLYRESLLTARQSKMGDTLVFYSLFNLGQVYLNMGRLDSALVYSQRAYEASIAIKYTDDLDYIYMCLGGVHSRLGNEALALPYFRLGIARAFIDKSPRDECAALTALAQHYERFKNIDSSLYYARKAVEVVHSTNIFHLSAKSAKLLASLYEGRNCDSSLKYARMAEVASDSLTNTKASQQIQLLTFDEDTRQREQAEAATHLEQQRQQNIQYALIALGIFVLLTLYLILSRSFITNIKTIEYAGIIGLLIVFEFLNLLLHPFLEGITHHSPILMLLSLVTIAALLVPLHHRLEKWAVATLVSKNKSIRLAAAKRTIEELER